MTTDEPHDAGATDDPHVAGDRSRPLLRVVRGDATPEEVAALVAVVASLGTAAEAPARPVSEWSAHHRKSRLSLPHGPGGWRSSGLPRG